MYYEFEIDIPANTKASAPVSQELKLTAGIVHYVEIEFPSGCAATDGSGNLVHLQIRQPEATYLPTNPDGSFASDNHVIAFNEHKELSPGNDLLKLYAWNDDDTYAHTLRLRIGVLPKDVVEPQGSLGSALDKFLQLVGIK